MGGTLSGKGPDMKQCALLDDDSVSADAPAQSLKSVGIVGSAKTLSKAQKQFNKFIAKIEAQLAELEQWREFTLDYNRRVVEKYQPLKIQLREKQIAMVLFFDSVLDSGALTKLQRTKLENILLDMVSVLLDESEDAALIRIHDKYADVSFAEDRQFDVEILQDLAREMFGVEIDASDDSVSFEQLREQFHEKVDAEKQRFTLERKPGKKNKKEASRIAAQEQAEQDATRALRDVYRKLASALHPDREPDPQRRAQATELMQQVNHAYGEGDLLALLKLQLQIEQLDAQVLAGIAEERLANYNNVLREQASRLQQELLDITVPFLHIIENPRHLTPALVLRELNSDVQDLKAVVKAIDSDLREFQDVRKLKSWLKSYRLTAPDDLDDGFY
jgi:hypothetical protein